MSDQFHAMILLNKWGYVYSKEFVIFQELIKNFIASHATRRKS